MNRATIAAVALALIVGGLGASHVLGDLLGMFSRGLGAAGQDTGSAHSVPSWSSI